MGLLYGHSGSETQWLAKVWVCKRSPGMCTMLMRFGSDNFERTQFFLGLCRGPPSPLALCMTRLQSKSHRIAALQGPSFGLYERLLCPPCVSRSCHIDLSPPGCQLLCTIFHQMSWHLLLDQNGRNGVDRACQITGFWCAFGALVG